MKTKLIKLLFACFISIGLFSTVSVAEAYHCKWVGGYHNRYGHYVPKHKVCYQGHRYNHCRFVGGYHNRHGYYVPRHKVCYWR